MSVHLSVVVPVYNERYLVKHAIDRLLAVESPLIERMDVIVVDDGSTDGSDVVLRALADQYPDRVTYVRHPKNQGKGAAVRTGIAQAKGMVVLVQDADLEYDPRDIPRLMVPFVNDGADAVFGSRFLSADYHRVLYYRHQLGNRLLTMLCDLVADVNLSDMECGYKAVRTRLLQSIPLRSNDFRMEPEITIKLAKRGARIFEVPISYAGRTYEEGKKIRAKDGLLALATILHWWLIDDLYEDDEYGSSMLVSVGGAPNFNRWTADTIRPFIGDRVLEVGAGLGNLTQSLLPRLWYTASETNPHYLDYLRNFADSKPYMDIRRVDLANSDDFREVAGKYDTVVCLNVLAHMRDEAGALANLRTALVKDGRAIILVPQDPRLYGSLDEVLGHQRRYTREALRNVLEGSGFAVERIFDFSRVTTPGWWLNGRWLRRTHFSKVELKIVNTLTWLLRRVDPLLPWHGTSLIAVARRVDI